MKTFKEHLNESEEEDAARFHRGKAKDMLKRVKKANKGTKDYHFHMHLYLQHLGKAHHALGYKAKAKELMDKAESHKNKEFAAEKMK